MATLGHKEFESHTIYYGSKRYIKIYIKEDWYACIVLLKYGFVLSDLMLDLIWNIGSGKQNEKDKRQEQDNVVCWYWKH